MVEYGNRFWEFIYIVSHQGRIITDARLTTSIACFHFYCGLSLTSVSETVDISLSFFYISSYWCSILVLGLQNVKFCAWYPFLWIIISFIFYFGPTLDFLDSIFQNATYFGPTVTNRSPPPKNVASRICNIHAVYYVSDHIWNLVHRNYYFI